MSAKNYDPLAPFLGIHTVATKEPCSLPTPEEFFLRKGLYQPVCFEESQYKDVLTIEFYDGTIDSFCVGCQDETVFQSCPKFPSTPGMVMGLPDMASLKALLRARTICPAPESKATPNTYTLAEYAILDRQITWTVRCTRDKAHVMKMFGRVSGQTITKIGQYPSFADLQKHEVKKYRKVLSEEQASEFTRALGLYAHGIGIGSFVYLRRIFEKLIEEAHGKARRESGWDENQFSRSRMDEKILLLKNYLPQFLTENSAVYSILSTGIHELSEDKCLEIFEPVRLAIELILDDEVARREREEKTTATRKKIADIRANLKGS